MLGVCECNYRALDSIYGRGLFTSVFDPTRREVRLIHQSTSAFSSFFTVNREKVAHRSSSRVRCKRAATAVQRRILYTFGYSRIRLLAELETTHSLPAASQDTVVKPFRTFAVHRLTVKQRCALLRSHYKVATKGLPARTFAALWASSRIAVGSLRGRKGNTYYLILGQSEHCAREGAAVALGLIVGERNFRIALAASGSTRSRQSTTAPIEAPRL
jgi:uncharacterized protein VirK/YbjX